MDGYECCTGSAKSSKGIGVRGGCVDRLKDTLQKKLAHVVISDQQQSSKYFRLLYYVPNYTECSVYRRIIMGSALAATSSGVGPVATTGSVKLGA